MGNGHELQQSKLTNEAKRMTKPNPKKGSKRGPSPEVLRLPGNWRDAVGKALAKGKPPKAAPKKKRRSK